MDTEPTEQNQEKIQGREIEDEMKSSYLDYSMSVIVGRALPDVRDGLKPVHRRILYAMNEMGLFHDKPFKKSATVVGSVLGKYHPHGDSAVYDALVRMAQDFSLRYPLIRGQGNFGSIDGDSAAAYRYTEAKLQKLSAELLKDIDKETVDYVPNFDASLDEPSVLPSKVPNLLINGSSGIAVGMATNIPPHNLNEVCEGAIKFIDNPEVTVAELMESVRGPDFPTAGIICGTAGIKHAYHNGIGRVRVRARTHTEEKNGRLKIIVTEIPYQVNKALLIEQIAILVKDKKIEGISDLRDESDRDGMRIVIELKQGQNDEIVLNQLLKHTRLQTTFGIMMLALVDNQPKILSLKQVVQHFVRHRQQIVRRRTEYDLKKAEERAHILEGLIVALNHIDDVIGKIKASKDVGEANQMLRADYSLSETQAKAILDMKLQKLASLEQDKIRSEHKDLLDLIDKLNDILGSEQKILQIIKDELTEMSEKYGDERRTQIIEVDESDIDMEDLIEKEDMVVTKTRLGYIKRLPVTTYKEQRRGGKGIKATGTRDEDFVQDIFIANTHSYLLFFTNKGKVHWLKVYKIPEASRQARGTAIVNLLELEEGERISAFVPVNTFENRFLVMATRNGTVKKTSLEDFSRPRRGGIIAVNLDEGDQLIDVLKTDGTRNILLATANGAAVRCKETDIRVMGRTARGVRGIKLRGEDKVIGMVAGDDNRDILTITENGYGKRTPASDYRLINRGGSGVINIKCSERNGRVVAVRSVTDDDEMLFISRSGIAMRTAVKGVSRIGRNTQGVTLMRMGADDRVVAAAKIVGEKEEEMPEDIEDVENEESVVNNADSVEQDVVAEEGSAESTDESDVGNEDSDNDVSEDELDQENDEQQSDEVSEGNETGSETESDNESETEASTEELESGEEEAESSESTDHNEDQREI